MGLQFQRTSPWRLIGILLRAWVYGDVVETADNRQQKAYIEMLQRNLNICDEERECLRARLRSEHEQANHNGRKAKRLGRLVNALNARLCEMSLSYQCGMNGTLREWHTYHQQAKERAELAHKEINRLGRKSRRRGREIARLNRLLAVRYEKICRLEAMNAQLHEKWLVAQGSYIDLVRSLRQDTPASTED